MTSSQGHDRAQQVSYVAQPEATNAALICRARKWHEEGGRVALAFVMQTWGSSPRPVGSVMIMRDDMAVEGSVSGGCVEGAVIEAALESLNTGIGQRLDFGVADAKAWEVGLSCGGKIAVLVTPISETGLSPVNLQKMADNIVARLPVRIDFDAMVGSVRALHDDDSVDDAVAPGAGLSEDESLYHFVQVPPRRIVIVGGVHISQFLAPMAQAAGYDVTVIDPRGVFASTERFPGVALINGWPDDAMADLGLDDRTAVVTLTHDPKIDDPGLRSALKSNVFYIGCLGSRRTHAARCERLAEEGFDTADLARLHGPAGLDIGARTPAEIAVSILAQLIAAERQTKGQAA